MTAQVDPSNAYIRLRAGTKGGKGNVLDSGWGKGGAWTRDIGRVRRHAERGGNLGILTGKRSRHFTVDVDPKNGGLETLARYEAEFGSLPETERVRTPSGGFHLNFRLPADFDIGNDTNGQVLGPGVDIKGEYGYRVAPGSTTAQGEYVSDGHVRSDAPPWLLDRLRTHFAARDAPALVAVSKAPPKAPSPEPCCEDIARRAVAQVAAKLKALAGLKEGERIKIAGGPRGWDTGAYILAARLAQIARWPHTTFTIGEAEEVFYKYAPPPDGTFDPDHKWKDAQAIDEEWFWGRKHRTEDHVTVLCDADGLPLQSTAARSQETKPPAVGGSQEDWDPVNLAALWEAKPVDADVGWRADRAPMFYRGKVNLVFGESASGKSWIALLACAQTLRLGGRVVYIDAEDGPHAITQRLKLLRVTREELARLTYVNPSTYDTAGRDSRADEVARADLVVFDATTEFLAAMGGLSSNSDTDIAQFMAGLPKWAARMGPAVVVIDHTAKDVSNRNGPQGSQHKRAAVDGAAYYVHLIEMFKRGGEGYARVYLNKDKQGGVGTKAVHTKHGELFADLRADPEGGGFRLDVPIVSIEIEETKEERARAKIESLKGRATAALASWDREEPPGSRNAVANYLKEQGVGVSDHALTKALLDSLVASGHLTPGYGFVRQYVPADAGAVDV